jgi:hypothetical protein
MIKHKQRKKMRKKTHLKKKKLNFCYEWAETWHAGIKLIASLRNGSWKLSKFKHDPRTDWSRMKYIQDCENMILRIWQPQQWELVWSYMTAQLDERQEGWKIYPAKLTTTGSQLLYLKLSDSQNQQNNLNEKDIYHRCV